MRSNRTLHRRRPSFLSQHSCSANWTTATLIVGLPELIIRALQHVQNAAAHLITAPSQGTTSLQFWLRMHFSFYFDIRIVGAYIRILFGIRFLPWIALLTRRQASLSPWCTLPARAGCLIIIVIIIRLRLCLANHVIDGSAVARECQLARAIKDNS